MGSRPKGLATAWHLPFCLAHEAGSAEGQNIDDFGFGIFSLGAIRDVEEGRLHFYLFYKFP